ncbi:MAG: HD domain-containing protein [Bacillaceae bacterium]
MNERINKAIEFACRAHEGQYRKLSNAPFISHPMSVAMTLQQIQCDEDTIIAGLLHDTIEDTNVTYDEIVDLFGERVAKIVAGDTEENNKSWEQRKQHTIDSIKTAPIEVILLILADKIHNLQTIYIEKEKNGEDIFNYFSRGKEMQYNYYNGIYTEIKQRQNAQVNQLLQEMKHLIQLIFK